MNSDQVTGVIRAIVPAVFAYLAARGWLGGGSVAEISAAVVTLLMAGWSIFNNKSGKVIA